jgi:hypothetical protein
MPSWHGAYAREQLYLYFSGIYSTVAPDTAFIVTKHDSSQYCQAESILL